MCAGVAAITAVKFLLRRGDAKPAPWNHQYDPFRGILAATKLRWGLNGPLLRFLIRHRGPSIIEHMRKQPAPPPTFYPKNSIDEILHAARWAPSGDNEQPWHFERLGDEAVMVHLAPHDKSNIYHYRDSEPNVLAIGGLLENLRIAASAHGRRMEWRVETAVDPLRLHVQFTVDATVFPDRLYAAIGQRSVDRNRYRTRKLTDIERKELEAALNDQLRIDWYSTPADRLRFARLSALGTNIRLRTPEAFPIHQRIIDWELNLSPTKIPANALGLRGSTRWILRRAMRDWGRMRLLNQLGGARSAALEMDYVPILSSAAAFTLRFAPTTREAREIEDLLHAGSNIQRFWLTATRLGLAMQPTLAILAFAHYGHNDLPFTTEAVLFEKAKQLALGFRRVFGAVPDDFIFMGRIGEPLPRMGVSRSVRRPVAELMI